MLELFRWCFPQFCGHLLVYTKVLLTRVEVLSVIAQELIFSTIFPLECGFSSPLSLPLLPGSSVVLVNQKY